MRIIAGSITVFVLIVCVASVVIYTRSANAAVQLNGASTLKAEDSLQREAVSADADDALPAERELDPERAAELFAQIPIRPMPEGVRDFEQRVAAGIERQEAQRRQERAQRAAVATTGEALPAETGNPETVDAAAEDQGLAASPPRRSAAQHLPGLLPAAGPGMDMQGLPWQQSRSGDEPQPEEQPAPQIGPPVGTN